MLSEIQFKEKNLKYGKGGRKRSKKWVKPKNLFTFLNSYSISNNAWERKIKDSQCLRFY